MTLADSTTSTSTVAEVVAVAPEESCCSAGVMTTASSCGSGGKSSSSFSFSAISQNDCMRNDDDAKKEDSTAMVDDCVRLLQREGIRCVAFDMDLTAVAQHSRGRLRRERLNDYLGNAVEAFVRLVPALLRSNIHVAVTTHSDEAELNKDCNSDSNNNSDSDSSNIILGDELVRALLERYFAPVMVENILVVAYNPRAHGTQNCTSNKIKRYHMRRVREHFFDHLQDSHDILLLDDTASVVRDCRETCGVRAIQVENPQQGLQWSDVLRLGTYAETNEYGIVVSSLSSSCDTL